MRLNLKPVRKFIKRHSHQIAAFVAGVGVVVTAVEAGKAGARIQAKISAVEASRGEALTRNEKIELCAGDVIVPTVTGLATVGAIATGTIASEKMIAGLGVLGASTLQRYSEYRKNVQEINPAVDAKAMSVGAKDRVTNYIRKGGKAPEIEEVLYYDTHTGQTFTGRKNLPIHVEERLRDIMSRSGNFTENTYRILMGETPDPISGDLYGWDQFSFINQSTDDPHLCIYEEICDTDDGNEFHVLTLSHEPDVDFLGNDYSYICSPFDVR